MDPVLRLGEVVADIVGLQDVGGDVGLDVGLDVVIVTSHNNCIFVMLDRRGESNTFSP